MWNETCIFPSFKCLNYCTKHWRFYDFDSKKIIFSNNFYAIIFFKDQSLSMMICDPSVKVRTESINVLVKVKLLDCYRSVQRGSRSHLKIWEILGNSHLKFQFTSTKILNSALTQIHHLKSKRNPCLTCKFLDPKQIIKSNNNNNNTQ